MDDIQKHPADTPLEAGKRPPFARPVDPDAGKEIGTGGGYSGQEYDSAGQAEWRAEQQRHSASGEVEGSGSGAGGGNPGEDYDSDSAAGDGYPRTGVDGEEEIVDAKKPAQSR